MNRTDSLLTTALTNINDSLAAANHNGFLGVSWDILLPAIISIGIFILGYFITGLQARRKAQKSRNLVRDTIVTWADANFETLDKYVQSIKDLAERIGDTDNIGPELFSIQHLTIDVLAQFSIDRLTDALVSGLSDKVDKTEKGAKLNAYLTSVSYLERTQKIVMEQYDQYYADATDLSIQWEKKLIEFMENCDMNTMRLFDMPMTPEQKFYSDIASFKKVTDNDFSKCSTGKNLVVHILRVFETPHIYTKEILDTSYIFRELKSLITQIDDMKRYKQLFLDDAEKIEKAIERFRSAVDFYREQKMKRFA